MTADDTSREALIERVENLLMDERDKYPRVHNDAPSADLAEVIVDAVVMPLVEAAEAELERLRVTGLDAEAWGKRKVAQRDAAIKRAEAAEAAHKALTEAVRHVLGSGYDDPMDAWYDLRAILDEHGAGR